MPDEFAALLASRQTKPHYVKALIAKCVKAAVLAEREACAKVCDYQITRWTDNRARYATGECAAAIRARGNP